MRTHIRLFGETWGESRNFAVLKRFFKIYVHGFPGASTLRNALMASETLSRVDDILREFEDHVVAEGTQSAP